MTVVMVPASGHRDWSVARLAQSATVICAATELAGEADTRPARRATTKGSLGKTRGVLGWRGQSFRGGDEVVDPVAHIENGCLLRLDMCSVRTYVEDCRCEERDARSVSGLGPTVDTC